MGGCDPRAPDQQERPTPVRFPPYVVALGGASPSSDRPPAGEPEFLTRESRCSDHVGPRAPRRRPTRPGLTAVHAHSELWVTGPSYPAARPWGQPPRGLRGDTPRGPSAGPGAYGRCPPVRVWRIPRIRIPAPSRARASSCSHQHPHHQPARDVPRHKARLAEPDSSVLWVPAFTRSSRLSGRRLRVTAMGSGSAARPSSGTRRTASRSGSRARGVGGCCEGHPPPGGGRGRSCRMPSFGCVRQPEWRVVVGFPKLSIRAPMGKNRETHHHPPLSQVRAFCPGQQRAPATVQRGRRLSGGLLVFVVDSSKHHAEVDATDVPILFDVPAVSHGLGKGLLCA